MASLYGQLLGGVIYGVFQLVIARGLFQRKRWAWIVTAVLQGLQFLATLLMVVFFGVLSRMLLAGMPGGTSRSGSPLRFSVLHSDPPAAVFAPGYLAAAAFFSYGDVICANAARRCCAWASSARPSITTMGWIKESRHVVYGCAGMGYRRQAGAALNRTFSTRSA